MCRFPDFHPEPVVVRAEIFIFFCAFYFFRRQKTQPGMRVGKSFGQAVAVRHPEYLICFVFGDHKGALLKTEAESRRERHFSCHWLLAIFYPKKAFLKPICESKTHSGFLEYKSTKFCPYFCCFIKISPEASSSVCHPIYANANDALFDRRHHLC